MLAEQQSLIVPRHSASHIRIRISEKAMAKITYWVDKSPVEVSGMGKITRMTDASLLVTDVFLVEQENSSTETEMNPASLGKLMFETKDIEGDLTFWWHSHVNMPVFWSMTDMEAIEQLGDQGYVVATVFNKRGEMRSAYYQGEKDIVPAIFVDQVSTEVYKDYDDDIYKDCEAEFKKKCKQKTVVYTNKWSTSKTYRDAMYDKDDEYYSTSKWWKWDERLSMWRYNGAANTLIESVDIPNLTAGGAEDYNPDVDQYTNTINFDGDIHPTNLELRFSEDGGIWVPYEEYAYDYGLPRTPMDDVREEWIQRFINEKGYFPNSDLEVEGYYMKCHEMAKEKFYLTKTWRDYDV